MHILETTETADPDSRLDILFLQILAQLPDDLEDTLALHARFHAALSQAKKNPALYIVMKNAASARLSAVYGAPRRTDALLRDVF